MKLKILLLTVSFFLLTGFSAAEDTQKNTLPQLPQTDVRVSMDFRDANVKDALKILSQQSGINFIPSDDVQDKKITLYLENVPIKDAIDSVIEANGLTYEQGPDTNIFIVRPSGVMKVKTVTKIYTLNFAQVAPLAVQAVSAAAPTAVESSTTTGQPINYQATPPTTNITPTTGIADIITKLLSPAGSLVVDQRTNSLIITDIPERFSVLEEMITKLDTPTPQVFIEAQIIETTLDVTDKLGLEYGGDDGTWGGTYTGPQKGYSFPYQTKSFKEHGASQTFTFGTMSFGDLTLALKALTTSSDTKYLARPKLLTLNNETAVIDITADTYVGQITTSQSQTGTNTTSAERMTTGVSLKVTPQVNAMDYITMILEPSVARTEQSAINTGFLNPIKRSAKAKVMIKDGETIFIGGLLDTQKINTKRSVPILGSIPIAGTLFKSGGTIDKQTEILIFITPHIVKSRATEEVKGISRKAEEANVVSKKGPSENTGRDQAIEETVAQLENKK